MPNPGHFAPIYGDDYGYSQGAQDDIFETINESNWTCPQSKARKFVSILGIQKVDSDSVCQLVFLLLPRERPLELNLPRNPQLIPPRVQFPHQPFLP